MNKHKAAIMFEHYCFTSNYGRGLTPRPTLMCESNESSEVNNNIPLPIFSSMYFDIMPLQC